MRAIYAALEIDDSSRRSVGEDLDGGRKGLDAWS
jgi:hypothetical protein